MSKMNTIEEEASSSSNTNDPNHKESPNKEEDVSGNKVPFYKLFSFADSTDIALMIIGSVGAVGNGLAMPVMSVLLGQLVDAFGQNQDTHHIIHIISKVALRFVYLALSIAVAAFIQVSCWMITGERQASRMRNLYLKSILRQDIAFFDKETNSGEVIGRVSGDTVLIQDALGEKVGKFIQLTSTFIGGFIIGLIKGWFLTLVMLSSMPVLAFAGALMSIILSRMAAKGQNAYEKAASIVDQTITSIRTVASFTGEEHAIAQYNEAIVMAYKSGVHQGLAAGSGLGAVLFVIFCSYPLAIWFGARMIIQGHYTGGTVITVIVAVLTGSMSLGEASPSISAFAAGQAAAYKMFETIKRKPAIDPCDPKGKVLDDIHGDIELVDVYFSYPVRPNEQIFSGLSLSMARGTTTALVGQSGSGKSTVISLIERFYDPLSGEVRIDGINIKEFRLKWIREKIGLVSQEPVLFGSSIRNNIAYGRDGATIEEIKLAAELANASKFIDKLPQGLDTLVGEQGIQLSGGQKQRVAIARAILKNPRILLLDEATSALDAESEKIVQEALDRIMVDRTTVVVAHRLSTIRDADVIAVIHQGKLVEKGSHAELLNDPEGAYSQLIHLQAKEGRQISKQLTPTRSFMRSFNNRTLLSSNSFSFSPLPVGFAVSPLREREDDLFPPSKEHPKVSVKYLASLNKPEIPALILGSLSAIISGLVYPIFGVLFSGIIAMFYKPPHELRNDARFWAVMFLAFGLVSLLSNPARGYFFAVAGGKLIQRIRSMCFERVVRMEVGWFDEVENSSGAIGARLSSDAASIRALVGDAFGLLVQNISTAIAGLLIAFLANWMLAFIVLALIPLIGINGYLQLKFTQGFSADAKKMYEDASQVASEAVGSMRTVASFCAEEKVIQVYEEKCKGPVKAGIKRGLISGIGFGMSFALLYSVYALSFYAGAQLVGHGKATFSDVFRVFFALTMTAVGMSQSSSLAPDTGKAKSAASSVFAILNRKSKIDSSDETGTTLDEVKGDIEFQHVSFAYPTRPDVQIFQGLCLSIRSGKTVALVGESGSGKSTVISLLQRFYDPDSGCITLDGIEIQKYKLKWLREQMGLVSQEPSLFNDTIRANIAYGKGGNATEAEIIAASEKANAHKFICSLEQGYDTLVGERGVQLSGGQKQRVAIARAIVKNPRILLLDEATSALDAESEKAVQNALEQVMINRTTVIVAHRLSTIKNADVIAVVKNGVIAERGNHEKLIRIKDGAYASLVAVHMNASSSS